jgi:hypothetical protein
MKSWVRTAQENKTWLILVFHEVDNQYFEYGTTPERFKEFIAYLKTNNISPITMRDGLNMMSPAVQKAVGE